MESRTRAGAGRTGGCRGGNEAELRGREAAEEMGSMLLVVYENGHTHGHSRGWTEYWSSRSEHVAAEGGRGAIRGAVEGPASFNRMLGQESGLAFGTAAAKGGAALSVWRR